MRTNSWETCCRQLYCFCLMHKAITACLIYFMHWMLAKTRSNAQHILLKMSQCLTACFGLTSPQCTAQSDVPAHQNVVVCGAKCHFTGLNSTKSNFPCFFERDTLNGLTYKTQLEAHIHTIYINIKQSPRVLTEDKQKVEHFARCQLQIWGQVIMILSLIDAACIYCYHRAHLWKPWANFIMFRHWRAWLKC